VSRDCVEKVRVRARLDEREEDSLSREGRAWLREHLRGCEACRHEALRRDPTIAFWDLPEEEPAAVRPVPPGARGAVVPFPSAACSGSVDRDALLVAGEVLSAIELQRARERLRPGYLALRARTGSSSERPGRSSRRPRSIDLRAHPVRLAAAAIPLAAALALLAAGLAGFWPRRDGPATAGGAPAISRLGGAGARPVQTQRRAADPSPGGSLRTGASTHPPIEDVSTPGATILQFAASRPGAPTVVFIVDRNADI
jgi:hypothetical protein